MYDSGSGMPICEHQGLTASRSLQHRVGHRTQKAGGLIHGACLPALRLDAHRTQQIIDGGIQQLVQVADHPQEAAQQMTQRRRTVLRSAMYSVRTAATMCQFTMTQLMQPTSPWTGDVREDVAYGAQNGCTQWFYRQH